MFGYDKKWYAMASVRLRRPDNVGIQAEHFQDPLLTLLEKTYYFIRRVAFDNETSFSKGRRFSYCRSCVKAQNTLLLLQNYGRLRAC